MIQGGLFDEKCILQKFLHHPQGPIISDPTQKNQKSGQSMLLAHSNVFQNGMSQSCSTNDHVLYIKGLDPDQVPVSGWLCNTPMKKVVCFTLMPIVVSSVFLRSVLWSGLYIVQSKTLYPSPGINSNAQM